MIIEYQQLLNDFFVFIVPYEDESDNKKSLAIVLPPEIIVISSNYSDGDSGRTFKCQ